jgi:hypothetical protein
MGSCNKSLLKIKNSKLPGSSPYAGQPVVSCQVAGRGFEREVNHI